MSIKKVVFKCCPKSGRIVGLRKDTVYHKLFFPFLGILSIIWVLIRVLPKPSRLTYPCQQVTIPIASSFIIWIGAMIGSVIIFKKAKFLFSQKRIIVASILIFGSAILFFGAQLFNTQKMNAIAAGELPNHPIGIAKGIFPGRVTWIRDTSATPWNGITGNWWTDNTGINESQVEKMISTSLLSLTGASTESLAWDKIFHYYNNTHNRGNVGYSSSEKIAIKINLIDCKVQTDIDNGIDASKQVILCTLRQLINKAGVAQGNITVYEGFRAIPNRIFDPCHAEFPNVIFADRDGTNGRQKIVWLDGTFTYSKSDVGSVNSAAIYNPNATNTQIPTCLHNATYLINMPLMKGHSLAGVTMSAKNHYGSIAARDHSQYLNASITANDQYSVLVDLMGSKQFDGKTILFLMDGLYGNITNMGNVNKTTSSFHNLFKGQWSSSIMMSLDEVALESFGYDLLTTEFGNKLGRVDPLNTTTTPSLYCDHYLHEAALANNPPSGTVYKPDGIRLSSLGVHEHWNNATEKKYSRNLGNGNGIELFVIKVSQTITFNALPAKRVGDPNFTLTANAYSGLSVTYTSSNLNVAKIVNGNQVQIIGSGICTITATQKGDATYSAAPVKMQNLTVGLPLPWNNSDIGSPIVKGSTVYKGGVFTLKGAGNNIGGMDDEFQYVFQTLNGDGQIITNLDYANNLYPNAQAGIMIRESNTQVDSKLVMISLDINNVLSFDYRMDVAQNLRNVCKKTLNAAVSLKWLKLTRTGNVYKAYYSETSKTGPWIAFPTPSITVPMLANIKIGMYVSSNNINNLCNVTFTDFSCVKTSAESNEIHDLSKDFEIFPNPAINNVTIRTNENTNTINIYNASGKIVYSNSIIQNEITISTDLIGKKGIYFVKINNQTKKLMILE